MNIAVDICLVIHILYLLSALKKEKCADTPVLTIVILAGLTILLTDYAAGASDERFLASEGEIFTVVDGKVGTQCTGKVVAISTSQIKITDKQSQRRTFFIDKRTRLCNRKNNPISATSFSVGELVTIATTDDDPKNAAGIRKGPILIRLTNMRPLPIGK